MKKIKLMTIVLFVIIVMTGCGNSTETLTCTSTEDRSGLNLTDEIVIDFKKDTVQKVKLSYIAKANDSTIKDNWDVFITALDSQYNLEKSEDGFTITTDNKEDDYTYIVTLEFDYNKVSDDILEEYELKEAVGKTDKKDNIKERAENSGYICK